MTATHTERNIRVICPICKSDKELDFPNSIINNAKQLTTVSVPTGAVCEHHFQMFIDKDFKVRGYQKVDFELDDLKKGEKEITSKEDESDLFENLSAELKVLLININGKTLYSYKQKLKITPLSSKKVFQIKTSDLYTDEKARSQCFLYYTIKDKNYNF